MITVVVPTLDAEAGLAATLTALVEAALDGTVRQVVVVDGGSSDRTLAIAEDAGADIVHAQRGRGGQLHAGALAARSSWLLFLHADTVLQEGWSREVRSFMESVDSGRRRPAAAAFRFALDDRGARARLVEIGVAARCTLFRLPYGDQGLLIRRDLYEEIGGYRQLALMEDVDIVGRLGRRRMAFLHAAALTSAVRYRRSGYARRIGRNLCCLTLYYLRVPLPVIERLYQGGVSGSSRRA